VSDEECESRVCLGGSKSHTGREGELRVVSSAALTARKKAAGPLALAIPGTDVVLVRVEEEKTVVFVIGPAMFPPNWCRLSSGFTERSRRSPPCNVRQESKGIDRSEVTTRKNQTLSP